MKTTEKQMLRNIEIAGYKFAIEYFLEKDDNLPIVVCGAKTRKEAEEQVETNKELYKWIEKTNIVKL